MGGSLSADNLNPISENKGFYISDVNKSYEIRYKIPRYQILEDHESGYGYKKLFFKNSSNTDGLNQEKIPSHSTYFAVHSGHKYSAELNIIKSSILFKNSGLKYLLTSSLTLSDLAAISFL